MLDENRARDELENILQQDEYTVYQRRTFSDVWWEKAKRWITELLEKLFPAYEATSSVAGLILISLILIVIALLAVIAFFIVRRTVRVRKFKDHRPMQANEADWSYKMHLSEAFKQQNVNEYSLATRHLFLALLLYFHENKWLEARIWKTNWEYYDELNKVNRDWAQQFYKLARTFDEVTYGERRVTEEEYVQFRQEVMSWLDEADAIEG